MYMMTSSNGNIFRVIGPLWGESNSQRWIPPHKGQDAELCCFLWSAPEQTVKQTIETLVIWDAGRAHYDATVMVNAHTVKIVSLSTFLEQHFIKTDHFVYAKCFNKYVKG